MGSILVLVSVALLRGPLSHMKHMLSKERIPFTVSYLGSMALTLYAAIGVSRSSFFFMLLNILIVNLKIQIASKNDTYNYICYNSNRCITLVCWILYSRRYFYIKIRYILYWWKSCLYFTHLITLHFYTFIYYKHIIYLIKRKRMRKKKKEEGEYTQRLLFN